MKVARSEPPTWQRRKLRSTAGQGQPQPTAATAKTELGDFLAPSLGLDPVQGIQAC